MKRIIILLSLLTFLINIASAAEIPLYCGSENYEVALNRITEIDILDNLITYKEIDSFRNNNDVKIEGKTLNLGSR